MVGKLQFALNTETERSKEQTFTIATEGGEFSAYVAMPAAIPAPVVIVLHEVFGVNEDIRTTCRELAEAGFVAIAPDLS